MQLLTARERNFPLNVLDESWVTALRGIVFVSLLLLSLVLARNELSALGIAWE